MSCNNVIYCQNNFLCKNAICPGLSECSLGTIRGKDGCCIVCIKEENEQCGGLHQAYGQCRSGLECFEKERSVSDIDSKLEALGNVDYGICQKIPGKFLALLF